MRFINITYLNSCTAQCGYGDNSVSMLLLASVGKFKNIPDIECVLVHKSDFDKISVYDKYWQHI